jgi:hypothetical protein
MQMTRLAGFGVAFCFAPPCVLARSLACLWGRAGWGACASIRSETSSRRVDERPAFDRLGWLAGWLAAWLAGQSIYMRNHSINQSIESRVVVVWVSEAG